MGDLQKMLKPCTFHGKGTFLAFWPHFSWFSFASTAAFLHPNKQKIQFSLVSTKRKTVANVFCGILPAVTQRKQNLSKLLCDSNSPTELILELPVLLQQHAHKCPHFLHQKTHHPRDPTREIRGFLLRHTFFCFPEWSRTTDEFCSKGTLPRTKDYQTINFTPLFCFQHVHIVVQFKFRRDAGKVFVQRQQRVDSSCFFLARQFFFSMATEKRKRWKRRKERKRERNMQPISPLPRERCPHEPFLPEQ